MSTADTGWFRFRGVLGALAAALMVLAPLGFVTAQFWVANGSTSNTIAAERSGVDYLNPALTPYQARDSYVPPYLAGPAGVAIRFAMAQLGKPYSWGSAGPESFDSVFFRVR